MEEDIKKEDKKSIEQRYLDKFDSDVQNLEAQFISTVNQFFAETKARLEKKNKKRPVKKKKK